MEPLTPEKKSEITHKIQSHKMTTDEREKQRINFVIDLCTEKLKSMPKIVAPFTPQQVEALNLFQDSPYTHPFGCVHENCQFDVIAVTDGWRCPKHGITQNWAHDFMADRDWIEQHDARMNRLFTGKLNNNG